MMKKLKEAKLGRSYFLAATAASPKLRELGLVKGKKIELLSITEANAIVLVAGARLAMDRESSEEIFITDYLEDEELVNLSDLKVGETGVVRKIESDFATKHRLMVMGITRGVGIYVRKMAPLGDPMELHLRGYSLSLRKADASAIKVVREVKSAEGE